jgi:beta-lactamase superfamily II metal-dependent hydrolase
MRLFKLLILLPFLMGVGPSKTEPSSQNLTVAFIDVGQGDATLIRDGNGFDILVDGGRKGASEYLLDYMREVGVDDLEVVLATHADSDHIGGLIAVIEADDIPVESVYYNGYPGITQTWTEFSDAVSSSGLTLNQAQYPNTFTWGGITAQVVNPISGMIDPEQNDASVVLFVDYAQISVLLPADIDSSIENQLSNRVISLQADILKVAHHGSKHSTSQTFLQEVQPREAIISVGMNSYGHPAPETLSRLMDIETDIWRTDIVGTILLTSDGESYEMLPKLIYIPLSYQTMQFSASVQ